MCVLNATLFLLVEKIDHYAGDFCGQGFKPSHNTKQLSSLDREFWVWDRSARDTAQTGGVLGEDLPKVVYRLIDPEQYRGQKVIVVGGGDSGLEAAARVADLGDTGCSRALARGAVGASDEWRR